ncbi:MAG: formylglycine-generating enzyme family protein [Chloroflexi bacterium]|nr:formylglycine-generating enzyme family protein [Chloroflexota bacterium]
MKPLQRLFLVLVMLILAACSSSPQNQSPPLVVDTGIDPNRWSLIPAGEFLYGQHEEEVNIEYDYEMMVTHVTNAQFATFLNLALADGAIKWGEDGLVGYYPGDVFDGYDHEREIKAGDWLLFPVGDPDVRIVEQNGVFAASPGYEDHPAIMVTWFGARAFCAYYGWRLPTEREWEKAARGVDGRAFPWGDEIAKNNANFYNSRDPFEPNGGLGDTTPVGFYNGKQYAGYQTQNSPSPYGLYDMAGNVWQWTADDYKDTHLRYLRGGSRGDYDYNLRVWTRNSASPDYYSITVGFRCARG